MSLSDSGCQCGKSGHPGRERPSRELLFVPTVFGRDFTKWNNHCSWHVVLATAAHRGLEDRPRDWMLVGERRPMYGQQLIARRAYGPATAGVCLRELVMCLVSGVPVSGPASNRRSCRSVAATGFNVRITSRQDDKHHDGVTGDPASSPRSCARITGQV